MKLFLQIIVPIIIYLSVGVICCEDREDVYYIIFLPLIMIVILATGLGFAFFLHWLY